MGKKFLTTEQMYAIMKNNSNAHLKELKLDDVADGLQRQFAMLICSNLQKISGYKFSNFTNGLPVWLSLRRIL